MKKAAGLDPRRLGKYGEGRPAQSANFPAASITGLSLAIWSATKALWAAGLTRLSATTIGAQAFLLLDEVRVLQRQLQSGIELGQHGRGVPLGAYRPCQMVRSNPFKPMSCSVG